MLPKMLITGATSGIGAALAARYAARADLLLAGRRASEDVAFSLPQGAAYVAADQRAPEAAADAVRAAIDDNGWNALDIAVLNAGTGFAGDPSDETAQTIRETLDVNLFAVIALAHRLHPLLARAGGQLVVIGSTASRGAPHFASYAASKAGLDGLARALAQEWRGSVAVQIIHPGPVATSMQAKAGFDPGAARRYFASTETMARLVEKAIARKRPRTILTFPHYLVDAAMPWRHSR